ncbi:aminoglycoside phosphotransferase family protein [Nocardia sp. NBC_01377]|uniref:phosphotransferase family protein n=1 Tax=Nocardia sp. NBC_01377 TaxID=2903595 RepID=UPI003252F3A0
MNATPTIPATPDDITASWLSTVLSSPDAPVTVTEVEVAEVGTGQTGATYRTVVEYENRPPSLPDSFVVKLPYQDEEVRARVSPSYRAEHAFYTQVAQTVRAPVPHCFHSEIASEGTEFVLLMEDLAPAVQGDQLAGCGVDDAGLAVEALAGLHGPRWCDPELLHFSGVTMPKPDEQRAAMLGRVATMAAETTIEKIGANISADAERTLREAGALVADWLMLEPDRYCLLHGDFRLDNLLFGSGSRRVTVVDWQTVTVGLPARDLAYFVATGLLADIRSEVERDLVARYHTALLTHGVSGYAEAQCWQDYRLGLLQIPLVVSLGTAYSAYTDRGAEMMVTMLERGTRAIRELGSLDLIRDLSGG